MDIVLSKVSHSTENMRLYINLDIQRHLLKLIRVFVMEQQYCSCYNCLQIIKTRSIFFFFLNKKIESTIGSTMTVR